MTYSLLWEARAHMAEDQRKELIRQCRQVIDMLEGILEKPTQSWHTDERDVVIRASEKLKIGTDYASWKGGR